MTATAAAKRLLVCLRIGAAVGSVLVFSGCQLPPLRTEILVVDPVLCALSDTTGDAGGAESGIDYMFCIPNNPIARSQVGMIDQTVRFDEGPRAKDICGDQAVLCIGSTNQPRFKSVLDRLSKLPYIKKISLYSVD